MLQHATQPLSRERLADCVAFYGVLGFLEVDAPPGIAGRAVWLQRGPTQIHLMPTDDPNPGSGHIGLVVEHYEQTIDHLRRHGHDVDPRAQHWGSPRAYVRDPAGNLVELMAFPPSAAGEPD